MKNKKIRGDFIIFLPNIDFNYSYCKKPIYFYREKTFLNSFEAL